MKYLKYLLTLLICLLPITTIAMELPNLYSESVIIYDPTYNEVLYEDDSDEVLYIASLTKIMTTIVAIENIDNLKATVTITKEMLNEVPSDASVAGLKVGDKVTYLDLLYATMLPSGADAATALAHSISGTTKEFVKLMNAKAKELGLKKTNFVNVTGLDIEGHHSTAKEVLTYLNYALKNELFTKIYTTRTYTLSNGLLVLSTIAKYGDKGYDLSNIIGSKTGFEEKAGLCMSAIINTKGKKLILITLGAPKNKERTTHIEDTLTIIDYLDANYEEETLYKKGSLLFSIPVTYSNIDSYNVYVDQDIVVYTDKLDNNDYKYEYTGLNTLSYHNKKGDKIGTISYYYQDKTFTQDVYLNQDINLSIIKYTFNHKVILIGLIVIVLCIILTKKKKRRRKRRHY